MTYIVGFNERQYALEPVMRDGDRSISGELMLRRAYNSRCRATLEDAEYFLANAAAIASEYQKLQLVFPGSQRGEGGDAEEVATLSFIRTGWRLVWEPVAQDFYFNAVAVKRIS